MDLNALEALLQEAKAIKNKHGVYTGKSYARLQKAINHTEKVLRKDKSETTIEREYNNLLDAIEQLEYRKK